MGGALLRGWLGSQTAAHIDVVEPAAELPEQPSVHLYPNDAALPNDITPDVVVFAVKPQAMIQIVPVYARFAGPETLFLSIAAGQTTQRIAALLGSHHVPIVRAMPNTPAAIGRGISAVFATSAVSVSLRQLATRLLAAVGEVAWVQDEALLDAATALSGSGPAYVFLLMETLAQAGIAAGLPPQLAEQLARATVIGSGALAENSPEPPAILRQQVTSPGGTTAAALHVLMDTTTGIQPLFNRALHAATIRARALVEEAP